MSPPGRNGRVWERGRGRAPRHPGLRFHTLMPPLSRSPTPTKEEPLGFILSMEGADPVLSPEQVEEWWQAGLRIIGPAHYGVSPYAHGTGTEGGLFPPGKPLLKEMQHVGMILDVTHLSDQCFDEA